MLPNVALEGFIFSIYLSPRLFRPFPISQNSCRLPFAIPVFEGLSVPPLISPNLPMCTFLFTGDSLSPGELGVLGLEDGD